MLKEDLWRKLDGDVKNENISSFRSFKKKLEKTESEKKVPLPHKERNNGSELPAKKYHEDATAANTVDSAETDNKRGQDNTCNEAEVLVRKEEQSNSQIDDVTVNNTEELNDRYNIDNSEELIDEAAEKGSSEPVLYSEPEKDSTLQADYNIAPACTEDMMPAVDYVPAEEDHQTDSLDIEQDTVVLETAEPAEEGTDLVAGNAPYDNTEEAVSKITLDGEPVNSSEATLADNQTASVDNKTTEATNRVIICPKCGDKIMIGSNYCGNCGSPIETGFNENSAAQRVDELKEETLVAAVAATGNASSLQNTAKDKTNDAVSPEFDSSSQEQSADSKNQKLIAMVVAAIIICGLGGYFLLGGSSGSKEDSTRYAAGQTNQAKTADFNQKPRPVEKPAPPPPPVVKQETAKNAFISFHTAITNRKLEEAYNILSPNYQRFMRSYDNFARGYTTTLRSDVVEMNTIQEDNNSAILSYKLKAVDQVDGGKSTQYFVGKAKLVKIDGQWRIESTEAKKASQNSSLPTNTVNSTGSNTSLKKTVGTITGNDVNVRKGPGVDYKSLGVFFKGDKVRIINSSRNSLNETWYKIEFDNPTFGLIVGWVRSDFININ